MLRLKLNREKRGIPYASQLDAYGHLLERCIGFGLLLFLTSCTFDEIDIDMEPNGPSPIFHFRYIRNPTQPLKAFAVVIKESVGQRTVWELWSFDRALVRQERGDGSMMGCQDNACYDQLISARLDTLDTGKVPEGFRQYYPPDNGSPQLENGTKYIIKVMSGAGEGQMEFMVDRICRKISRSTYSRDLPEFSSTSNCP